MSDDPVTRHEFNAFAKLMDERKDAQRDALALAQQATDARFEQVNNFRAQVTEERGRYVTQERYDVVTVNIERRVNELQQWRANMAGRMWAIGAAVVLITLIINGFGLYLQGHK